MLDSVTAMGLYGGEKQVHHTLFSIVFLAQFVPPGAVKSPLTVW